MSESSGSLKLQEVWTQSISRHHRTAGFKPVCNFIVMITCDMIVKSGKNIIAVNIKIKMLLDCMSLLRWEVFQFCNVFKWLHPVLFFFNAIFEQPQTLRLLDRRDERTVHVYSVYTYDILPHMRIQTNLKCAHDANTKDSIQSSVNYLFCWVLSDETNGWSFDLIWFFSFLE